MTRPLPALLPILALLVACGVDRSSTESVDAEPETTASTPANTPSRPARQGVSVTPVTMKNTDSATPTKTTKATKPTEPTKPTKPTKKKNRWLGLSVANMTDPIPGAPADRRGVVSRAFRGGPAHQAGLQRGDVLLQASGRDVLKYQDYIAEARKIDVGDQLPLTVLRGGTKIDVRVTMIDKPRDLHRWKLEHWKGTEMLPWEGDFLRAGDGKARSADAGAKVRVLYFWATWCGPCRTTAPMIEKLHGMGDGVEVLAVSSEERAVIAKYLEKSRWTFPVVHDVEGHFKLDYEVKKLPTIVVIDARGRVVSWDTSVGGVRRAVATVEQILAG